MTYTPRDYKLLRYGNYSMLIFSVMGLLGFAVLAGFWPPPPEYLSAAEIGKYYRENSFSIRVGMILMINGIPFYLIWGVVVSKILERLEGGAGILSKMELVGAATSSLILAIPGTIWLVAAFRPEVRTDAEIQLMYDLAWLMFDIPFMFFAVQYVSTGVAILMDKREKPLFPRWLAWLAFFDTFTFIAVLLVPFVYTGPFAWQGLISFWVVFIIFFVYLLAFMAYVPGALRKLQEEDRKNAPAG